MVFLDYETRSRADLPSVGQSAYARHESTTVLCLAYAEPGGRPELWTPGEPLPGFFHDPTVELHAHNAPFEIAISRHVMPRLAPDFPEIPLRRWHCTAARAAAVGLPRALSQCAKALGLAEAKDDAGHRVMLQLSKPRKPSKNNPAEWVDDPAKFARLYDYCRNDVVVEMAIHNATPDLSPRERVVWLLDQTINDRGIPVDLDFVAAAIACDAEYTERLTAELAAITGGAVTSSRQVERLIGWLAANGVNVDNVQAATVDATIPQTTGPVRRVLEIRRTLGRASTAKFQAMRDRADADGRVRGCHIYHQATTGRWAGSGVQTQNIPRGVLAADEIEPAIAATRRGAGPVGLLYGDVAETLSSLIRPAIRAPEGRDLIVCDFAAIEARVLAWLAGQADLIELFETGADVYLGLASKIYGRECTKADKAERQVGKIAVLGLGYGMGAAKFAATCAKFGVTVDDEFADRVVAVYRAANSAIKSYWYRLNDAAVDAARSASPVRYRYHRIERRGRWLFLQLPSGREIAYPDPRVTLEPTPWGEDRWQLSYMTINSYTRQWARERTYGGKLVENVVQATARDLLAEAMLRLEARGYRTVFHVHDEVVTEQPAGVGSVAEVESIISERPVWASDCPVAAEGFRSERYRK